jgi:hypothetical protein
MCKLKDGHAFTRGKAFAWAYRLAVALLLHSLDI